MGTLYSVNSDTDHDGVPDAIDTCPTGTVSPKPAKRSRLPGCYLGTTGGISGGVPGMLSLPPAYQRGAWLTAHGCTAAMVFPVDDVRADGTRTVGIVIAGTSPGSEAPVLTAAAAGQAWPSTVDAQCAISIDFASPAPLRVIEIPQPSVANFYVHWSPALKTPSAGDADQYIPADGLGLFVAADGVSAESGQYVVRGSSRSTTRDRIRLTRSVLWVRDLNPTSTWTCPASAPPGSAYGDPVRFGAAATLNAALCLAKTSAIPQPSFVAIPTGLDDALLRDRDSAVKAFTAGYAPVDPYINEIEGLPTGYAADDRYWDDTIGHSQILPLPTGATFFAPQHFKGTWDLADPWLIVPASIARTGQNVTVDSAAPGGFGGVLIARPTGPAQYSPTGHLDLPGTRLVFQQFMSGDGTFKRGVETIWPHQTPTMATSERSLRFGHRWTTNANRSDCWSGSPDATGGYPGYPLASAIGPSADAIATAWCPVAVKEWTDEEAVLNPGAGAATTSQADADRLCSPFKTNADELTARSHSNTNTCILATGVALTFETATCVVATYFGGGACWVAIAALVAAAPAATFECAV
jgi:hypothetical protein